MRELFQSTGLLIALTALLGLSVFNTCQIDNLERELARIERTPAPSAETAPLSPSRYYPDVAEREALANADNLLVPMTRLLNDDRTIARGGTLKLQASEDPQGFNPYVANGSDAVEFARYFNNMLCQRDVDDPGRLTPDLALSIVSPDDGRTYEVTLRRDVEWHQPAVDIDEPRYRWLKERHELTSDDYIFVFDMMANEEVSGRISAMRNYFDLESYEALDRYRFRITYRKREFTNLPNLCTLHPAPRWLLMHDESGDRHDEASWGKEISTHWYNNRGIGVGPYRFVEWDRGSHIRFEANDAYFGEPPAFDQIVVRIVKDKSAWTRMLKTGELDLTRIQPEQYRREILDAEGPILGEPRIKSARRDELGYFYVAWNMRSPLFGDANTRQAMTHALDRPGLVRSVFHELGEVTHGPFPMQNPCYDHSIEGHPYDLDLARAKLERAGWTDSDGDGVRDKIIDGKRVSFEFTLMIYGSSTAFNAMASVYREALLDVGVKLEVRPVEWSTFLKKVDERDFDAYAGAWVMDWEIDLHQLWHSSEADRPGGSNTIGFKVSEADHIIDALRSSFDPKERVDLCHQFHEIVHELQPYTFIYQRWQPVLYWDHLNPPEFHKVYPFRDPRLLSFATLAPE